MKICFITPTLAIGGYEKFLLNLIDGINKKYDIYLIAINGIGGNKDKFINLAQVEDLKCNRARDSFLKLARKLNDINPDIVYSSFTNFNILIFSIKVIFRMKFKIIIGEHLITTTKNKVERNIFKYIYNKSDCIVAVSKFTKNKLIENIGIKKEKIKVIYNPIINNKFIENYNECYQHKWINKNYINIVLVGRLEEDKGFQYILKAFSKIEKKNARLFIVGDGSYKQELKRICLKNNIIDLVEFTGFTNNPIKILKNMDLHFVVSDYETFGNTVVEALYCYCNVITYKGIGGPEEILEGGYGKIMENRDIYEIKNIIEKSIKKTNNDKLRKRAFLYNDKKIINQYIEIFDDIVNDL